MDRPCEWTALVITCKTKRYADAIQRQLELRQSRGLLPNDLTILCIEDPQDGIGSGGATLNALLTLTEHLSMKQGYTVVTSDALQGAKMLIMHIGRYFPYDPCGRSFVCLPLSPENGESEDLVTNFDALYYTITSKLARDSPPGLWVCSSDMFLNLPESTEIDLKNIAMHDGVLAIAVPATAEYAAGHGVFKIDENGNVKDLIFRGTASSISECCVGKNTVPLAAGIVFFSMFATERLLTTHVTPPLDACTYLGIDSGMEPVCISLFFDMLLAMASDVNEEEFITGKRSGAFGQSRAALTGTRKKFMQNARAVLWKHMRSLHLKVRIIEGGVHRYLDMKDSPERYCRILKQNCPSLPGYKFCNRVHSHVHESSNIGDGCILINSLVDQGASVGNDSILIHSHITKNIAIGSNCYIYGLDGASCKKIPNSQIPSNSVVIGMPVQFGGKDITRFYVSIHSDDKLLGNSDQYLFSEKNTRQRKELVASAIANARILPFSYRNVVNVKNKVEHQATLFMARVFPVFNLQFPVDITHSLQLLKNAFNDEEYHNWFDCWRSSFCEMLENVDNSSEFHHRQSMYFSIACKRLHDVLSSNLDTSLLPFFKMFVITNNHQMILSVLDKIAIEAVRNEEPERKRPDISARAFACIADVLGYMSRNKGGLRSGPAANKQWKVPLALLESGDLRHGVLELAKIREDWLHHPDLLIRAARHYEGAEQILIRHAVMSAATFIKLVSCECLGAGTWYTAECPARIDISGTWTDTPPVCYEHGGSVVNIAILLDGERPIGARIRKLKKPIIVLTLLGNNENETQHVECTSVDQMMDYNQPQAPAALLKACIILSKIVRPEYQLSMEEQLMSEFGGGFELQTWSNLPRGSGLGTSSILAGAIMRVVFRAAGQILDNDSIIHSVLLVEQMLTTGGGWQDQVGGLVGGFKIGRSARKLPLQVTTECLVTSEDFYGQFANHLKLIYTGKTRLARNLLQNVLRNWYTKRPDIIKNCHDLRRNAEACAMAVKDEDMKRVGEHMNICWNQKKLMASGCEPDLCARMMKVLLPYSLGQALAGAGGGGFMYVLTKEPLSKEFITSLLKEVEGAQDAVVYDVEVDKIGMTCHSEYV